MALLLENLTLCIFTYNRHQQVLQVVEYYSNSNLKIVILDASDQINPHEFPRNVQYLHVPGMSLTKRLRKFATLVNSDYILLSPDDDFYSLSGVTKIINYLDNNTDYSSAQGLRIRFFDKPFFNWIPDYLKQIKLNFDQDDPIQRTLDMAKSMHYIYSIIRTSNYIKIVNCLENTDSNSRDSYALSELIFNYCLPVFGKHKVLPYLYQLRKSHEYSGHDINFGSWVNNHLDDTSRFLKSNVIDLYTSNMKISVDLANEIYSILTMYFSASKKVLISQSKKGQIQKQIKSLLSNHKIFYFFRLFRFRYFRFYLLLIKHRQIKAFKFELSSIMNLIQPKTNSIN